MGIQVTPSANACLPIEAPRRLGNHVISMCVGLLLLVCSAVVHAADRTVPRFVMPDSNQLSPEALALLERMDAVKAPDLGGDVERQRVFYGRYNDNRLAEVRAAFSTDVRSETLGGVHVAVVTPRGGVAKKQTNRVLINVHGGAFMWGSGSGALVEAIPIAATMGARVVTVDYRLAPEHRFPAASEDVAAVYRALLKRYHAGNIGIYGCSAGGIITAQTVAYLDRLGLPRPGAIATLCGTGAPYSGDSVVLAGPLSGDAPPPRPLPTVFKNPYMADVPASYELAYPLLSMATTSRFPPTLLLAGGRDFAASALTLAHRRFAAAGVPSELYLFDGLPHAFFVWPDMPESREAYGLIAGFFDRHLGVKDLP